MSIKCIPKCTASVLASMGSALASIGSILASILIILSTFRICINLSNPVIKWSLSSLCEPLLDTVLKSTPKLPIIRWHHGPTDRLSFSCPSLHLNRPFLCWNGWIHGWIVASCRTGVVKQNCTENSKMQMLPTSNGNRQIDAGAFTTLSS